jgi:CDP-diacylglycerol--serine O-phosphatidyltransferase
VKRIAVLPTLLTLGNGVCGFASIAYASKITLDGSLSSSQVNYYFLLSAALILAAMVFDALDGAAARLSRSASDFGGELDSLCDAVSFGAAPAFLLLRLGLEWQGHPVMAKSIAIIAALYLACTVLRLARFNTENSPDPASHKRFKGLPSPAAAGGLASLAILRATDFSRSWTGLDEGMIRSFVGVWAPFAGLILALLMVSRLPYPHFTRQLLRGRRSFRPVVQALLVLGIIAFIPELAIFLFFWAYALNGPVRFLLVHAHARGGEAVPNHTARLD